MSGAGRSRKRTARAGPHRYAPRLQYVSVATLLTVRLRPVRTFFSIRMVSRSPYSQISRSIPSALDTGLPVVALRNSTNWRALRDR